MNADEVRSRLAARRAATVARLGRRSLKILMEAGRQCGTCQECCRLMGVDAVQKERFSTCRHQGPGGCGVQDHKPAECSRWACLWLSGVVDGESPDRQGVLFNAELHPAGVSDEGLIGCMETRPYAFAEVEVASLVEGASHLYRATLELIPYRPEGSTGRELLCLPAAMYLGALRRLSVVDFQRWVKGWLAEEYFRIALLNRAEGREVRFP